MIFTRINAGKFHMGSQSDEKTSRNNERPVRECSVKSFFIGIHPVTQNQYFQLTNNNPSYFSEEGKGKEYIEGLSTSNFPVESVSWEEAVIFCRKLSSIPEEKLNHRYYRLPTEIEWEYACRGGRMTPFNTGDTFTSYDGNINGNYPYNSEKIGPTLNRTCEVGSYPPNSFGIHDMHGNVWEWCYNEYSTYGSFKTKGQKARVLRGGSWNCYSRFCRSSYRCIAEEDVHYYDYGFRIVCEIDCI